MLNKVGETRQALRVKLRSDLTVYLSLLYLTAYCSIYNPEVIFLFIFCAGDKMTVTQKNSRSQRTTKSSKTKKTVLPQVSGTAIESSQLVNGQDALAVSPMWNSESDTIMDLQAYYLLAADLLEKVEVDYAQDESLIQITSRLWQEWQECYPYDAVPQQAGRSLITRLNLIKALRLVYNIKSAFDDLSRSSLKKVANWTKNLLDLLSDKFAEGKFMNSSACINILVELKRLVYF